MAKDPAFLFYPNDWIGGTMILNRHQKGCYIDLLVAQFNNGPLSLETIKTVLGPDQASWTVLSSKFKQDSEGNFFNERLATEVDKRRAFSLKQSINGSKGGRKPSLNPTLKPNESLLENRNGNEDQKGGPGENDHLHTGIVPDMLKEFKTRFPKYPDDPEKDFPALLSIAYKIGASNGWKKATVISEKRTDVVKIWIEILDFVSMDSWYSTRSISDLNKEWQRLMQGYEKNPNGLQKKIISSAPQKTWKEQQTEKFLSGQK